MKKNKKTNAISYLRYSIMLTLMLLIMTSAVFANNSIKISIAGDTAISYKQAPYKDKNGRLWVEASSIVQKLGGKFFYNKQKNKISIVDRAGYTTSYTVGQSKVSYNNQAPVNINFAPVVKADQVMFPLDEILIYFGMAFKYDESTQTIYIFDMDSLVKGILVEKRQINNPFDYFSDIVFDEVDREIVYYNLYRDTENGLLAHLVDTYIYNSKTGELKRQIKESTSTEYIGTYPINKDTISKYKFDGWIRFQANEKNWDSVADLIFSTIEIAYVWDGFNNRNVKLTEIHIRGRGILLARALENDYPANKSKVFIGKEKNGLVKIDSDKASKLAQDTLGGLAHFREQLYDMDYEKSLLYLSDKNVKPVEYARLKYRKVEGNQLIIKGDIINTASSKPRISGTFTAYLEKNPKGVIFNGYVLKSVDYSYTNIK